MSRFDNSAIRDRIISTNHEERKSFRKDRSALWNQQKEIIEGKSIMIYDKTKAAVK